MSQLDLSRMQFAMTSIYHFLFVPVTIGLAFLVAILQTWWHRTGDPEIKRLTRFFGSLMLINVAIGVVTGLIQEFQFGMNWSAYSKFVGDVFGAPLAMEGLAAFFLESTFLGLWLFGWNVLPRRVHLACIWAAAIGTVLSAAFIMAANSWMQHPVGYAINEATGRAELNSITDIFTNPVFIWAYLHVLLVATVTGSIIMLSVSAWHLRRGRETAAFTRSAKLALVVLTPASMLVLMVGSHLGVIETTYQPMKVAAMEAQWDTCQPCSFSVFQVGGGKDDQNPTKIIQIPYLLSLLATGNPNGEVQGLTPLEQAAEQTYGPGSEPLAYVPNVFVQYWSMRVMAYIGSVLPLLALWGLWLWKRQKLAEARVFLWVAMWAAVTPFIMSTAGWMLTENGRQPWIVQGLQLTADGVSPSVSTLEVAISITVFAALFVAVGIAWVVLMLRHGKRDLPAAEPEPTVPPDSSTPRPPALTY